MPVEVAVVARDDAAPARDLDADAAAEARGPELGRALDRGRAPAALVAQDVETLRVLEPVQVALFGKAPAAEASEGQGDERAWSA